MKKEQLITTGIIGFALYLIATGISFGGFSLLVKSQGTGNKTTTIKSTVGTTTPRGHFVVDTQLPKTEVCPLNGEKFSKQEQERWNKNRPITTMIENHADSRPQSGLSYADVVYETVAEGGITRFLAVFYCGIAAYEDVRVAPVRSARIYFVQWASEYADRPIYMHIGGANDYSGSGDTAPEVRALEFLESIGWRVAKGIEFDTFLDVGFPVYVRNPDRLDYEVATEHTMTSSLKEVLKEAAKRGWSNVNPKGEPWNKSFVSWKFKDEAKESERGASFSASFGWGGYNAGYEQDYDVRWVYDRVSNIYKRFNGGKPHEDLESKEQLFAKNVIIQFTKEKASIDRNHHNFYTTTGTGDGLVFQDGKVVKVTWKKEDRLSRTKFYETNGKEVQLNGGKIWIEVLPIGAKVQY